jgi:hypothetical protein
MGVVEGERLIFGVVDGGPRHLAVTIVYGPMRDLSLAQQFARHASPLPTVIYTHPADEELAAGVSDLPC